MNASILFSVCVFQHLVQGGNKAPSKVSIDLVTTWCSSCGYPVSGVRQHLWLCNPFSKCFWDPQVHHLWCNNVNCTYCLVNCGAELWTEIVLGRLRGSGNFGKQGWVRDWKIESLKWIAGSVLQYRRHDNVEDAEFQMKGSPMQQIWHVSHLLCHTADSTLIQASTQSTMEGDPTALRRPIHNKSI